MALYVPIVFSTSCSGDCVNYDHSVHVHEPFRWVERVPRGLKRHFHQSTVSLEALVANGLFIWAHACAWASTGMVLHRCRCELDKTHHVKFHLICYGAKVSFLTALLLHQLTANCPCKCKQLLLRVDIPSYTI